MATLGLEKQGVACQTQSARPISLLRCPEDELEKKSKKNSPMGVSLRFGSCYI
jgi:hypothetical protein